jgi:N-acetylneuraminic acid mutarotase
MTQFREAHTTTLLSNGKVLVAGGARDGNETGAAELYEPTSGTWTNTGSMRVPRQAHTATLLHNGKVLVAGGYNGDSSFTGLNSAEIYDPTTGTWTLVAPMNHNHFLHAATLLMSGKVLVVGNWNNSLVETNAEIFDPVTGVWTDTAGLTIPRARAPMTLLPDGRVLLVGGWTYSSGYLDSTEIYDPTAGTWTVGNSMSVARQGHSANLLPDGRVLVTGGSSYGLYYASMEFYDPNTGNWTTASNQMTSARVGHSATLLPNGKVLLAGGLLDGNALATAEMFDPLTGTTTATASYDYGRWLHSATLLPEGRVLVAGGRNSLTMRNSMLYDPQEGEGVVTGDLLTARYGFAATLLTSGTVLVAGGMASNNVFFTNCEVFNPQTGVWQPTGVLTNARTDFALTLLPSGKVVACGGVVASGNFAATDVYDPVSGNWSPAGAMITGRFHHSVTLLPNGRVLAAGGLPNGFAATTSCELFNPDSRQWTPTGSMVTNRESHTAVLLPNGKVLVFGGHNNIGGYHALANAEIYDPGSGKWTATASMTTPRTDGPVTVLLPNGKVLVAGGYNSTYLETAELYNPVTGTWTATGRMKAARMRAQAALLSNGKVLVVGGVFAGSGVGLVEVYDPVTGVWTGFDAGIDQPLYSHAATLLLDGRLLVTGGTTNGVDPSATSFLFEPSPGISPSARPQISFVSPSFQTDGGFTVNGSGFWTTLQGTSGRGDDTARSFPLIQLRSLVNGDTRFVAATNWSASSFNSGPVTNFPPGPTLATVYVNGIRSASAYLVKKRSPASLTLSNLSQVFNATSRQPSATTIPVGRAVYYSFNGVNTPVTNVGSYTVVGNVDDADYEGSITNTFVITPATATITLTNLVQTYNGGPHPVGAVTIPPGLSVLFTYNGASSAPTNPGSYAVIGTIADSNAFPVSVTNTLVVNKAPATITLGPLSQTYTGGPLSVTAATIPYGLQVDMTYNGSLNAPTNAGSYTVISTVDDPYYSGIKTNTLIVSKATGLVIITNLTFVYDGNPHPATITTSPTGLLVNVTYNSITNVPVNAGSYTVRGVITNQNHQGSNTATLVIAKAPASVTLNKLYQTYSGSPLTVSAVTVPLGLTVQFTYNGSSSPPVAAGNYTVIGTVSAANYSGAATDVLQIFPPIVLTAAVTNGVFTINFTNKAGSTFTVLGAPEFPTLNSWTNLGVAVEISSGRFQFSDFTGRTNSPFFYRVRSP